MLGSQKRMVYPLKLKLQQVFEGHWVCYMDVGIQTDPYDWVPRSLRNRAISLSHQHYLKKKKTYLTSLMFRLYEHFKDYLTVILESFMLLQENIQRKIHVFVSQFNDWESKIRKPLYSASMENLLVDDIWDRHWEAAFAKEQALPLLHHFLLLTEYHFLFTCKIRLFHGVVGIWNIKQTFREKI